MPDPHPSFTRGLFAGVIHSELLFPYPEPLERRDPDEARTVRRLIDGLRGLLAEGMIDPARFDEEEGIPEAVIRAFAELGMLGLTIPREYGGLGLSSTAYARVFAELSAIDPSLGVLVGVHCGLGAKAIVLFGTAEQKARYLPMLARGETLAAYALTEPQTGSDAQHIVTQARRSADGSHWILNGEKLWIGNGHRAGVIATFAQTEVERRGERVQRPTAFIIRPDMPGFRVVETIRKMGIRGSTQARLAYEELQVPADHVLGQVGKGFGVAVHVLNGGRLTLAAGCTGATKMVLGEMAAYAEGRVQFGSPIAAFEITQRKLATLAAETYAADAMLGLLAAMVDRDGGEAAALEAACAKVFCSELIWRAADEMVQVAGGRGFVKPYPYERMLRDSRINRIFEGTNEILRLFIGLNGIEGPAARLKELGAALRRPLRNLGLVSGYAASRVRSALGASAELEVPLDPRLEEHRRYFVKHVAELAAAAERAVLRHRQQIVERQLVVERLADMAIAMYATAAVLSRTQRLIEERGVDGCAEELALCDLFCVEAGRRFRAQREALNGREEAVDDTRRTIAAAVRAHGGYWVTDAILPVPAGPGATEPAPAGRGAP
ncbi:MAG TPA: acyl-CoA dehydrogenase family protein [Gemmatimonadaceae bacterium]|nr:acyl-CoA dehydrogenase family protein [Gemmatimonadaceae bacterium]